MKMVRCHDYFHKVAHSFHWFYSCFQVHAHEVEIHRPRLHRPMRVAAYMLAPRTRTTERQTIVNHYFDESNCNPPPLFVIIISIVGIVVFIYYCTQLKERNRSGFVQQCPGLQSSSPLRGLEIFDVRADSRWLFHVLFSIIVQLLLGIPLELVHKGYEWGTIRVLNAISSIDLSESVVTILPTLEHLGVPEWVKF